MRTAGRVCRVLAVYVGAVWVYVAVFAVFRPGDLGRPVWHGLPGLHRDTTGAVCFVASFALYALGRYWTDRP